MWGQVSLRYTATDVFETFPFPPPHHNSLLEVNGKSYYEHRRQIMVSRKEGLTTTYNRFHDPEEISEEINHLRDLHIELDNTVNAAYGWDNITLNHGFHETQQGVRFTISGEARREVLKRLLELNHQRYQEEVAQGLHEKKKRSKKKGGKKKVNVKERLNENNNQISFFNED